VEIASQIADFLLRKKRKAPATYDQYRFVLERVLMPWCQQVAVSQADELTDSTMMRFTDHLQGTADRPLAPASVQTYIRSVRIFLNWCKVPPGDYEPVRVPHRMRDTLSRVEVDRMESAAKSERDKLIVRVLADSGIRVGELTGLRPQDLRADTHAKMYFVRVIGKGDQQRDVAIPEVVYRRLRQFSLDQPEWIFNLKGERMKRHNVDYVIHKLAKSAGIGRRVWPHLLRHSWATQQIRTGKASLIDIQRALGHTTLAMVSTIYAHTTPADSYNALMSGLK
jgi:integrase/recombinase XerD